MKKCWILVAIATALLGTGLHFLYPLWPIPLVGLFAPVNESVWEHLKLLYWPFLLCGGILAQKTKEPLRAWSGLLLAQLLMPIVLLSIYYVLGCGFAVHGLVFDIVLYYLALAFGFVVFWRKTYVQPYGQDLGALITCNAIYAMCLILFTIAAPTLPIFQIP